MFLLTKLFKMKRLRNGLYEELNEKGFPTNKKHKNDNNAESSDIIIGKVTPIKNVKNSNNIFKDNSEVYRAPASVVIDKVYNNDGYEVRKVRIASDFKPRTGDMYCSRHAQKGTIGIRLNLNLNMLNNINP